MNKEVFEILSCLFIIAVVLLAMWMILYSVLHKIVNDQGNPGYYSGMILKDLSSGNEYTILKTTSRSVIISENFEKNPLVEEIPLKDASTYFKPAKKGKTNG